MEEERGVRGQYFARSISSIKAPGTLSHGCTMEASAALAAWYLWQLMTFLPPAPLLRRLRGSHNACAPLVCLLSSPANKRGGRQFGPPLFPPEKAAICLLSCWSVSNIIFPTRFLSPVPAHVPPPFLLVGKGRWLGGCWVKGVFYFLFTPKKKFCPCYLLEQQRVKTCRFFRIFFDFWRTFFSGKKGKFDRVFCH